MQTSVRVRNFVIIEQLSLKLKYNSPMKRVELCGEVPSELNHLRLDQALAKMFPTYSRGQLQNWIRQGSVTVNGMIQCKPREKIRTGHFIQIVAECAVDERFKAQDIPLDIVYEDEALIIINKPSGLVVHPGAGRGDNTLLNALLNHDPSLASVPRAGIVHRLDKDTSGLMIVAKTLSSHQALVQQMKQRQIKRQYEAIVTGVLISGGTVDAPIGRHPVYRTRMAVVSSGKQAITHYRILEKFPSHTYIRVQLETGRTHQIRVHMAYIHHPLVGDPVYGKRVLPKKCSQHLKSALEHFNRQALHASLITLIHPTMKTEMKWRCELPEDMHDLLRALRL